MHSSTANSGSPAPQPGAPWWRYPMMWLVVGGPAAVVVAGFITLWLAVKHVDPVLTVPSTASAGDKNAAAPAMQARNHAATPSR
ncbi:MAG: nitrogen fixation protein FixH [Rhizobacter sp.]|nr:nitrogen fixation protein FixH [Rhizobacter sp.]